MLYDGSSSNNTFTGPVEIDGTLTVGDYTLPEEDGTNLQVLKTDGLGIVTWQTDIAGSGDVIFNGIAPVVVGDLAVYGATDGKSIKESGTLETDLFLKTGTRAMTGDIAMGANNINNANLINGPSSRSIINMGVLDNILFSAGTAPERMTLSNTELKMDNAKLNMNSNDIDNVELINNPADTATIDMSTPNLIKFLAGVGGDRMTLSNTALTLDAVNLEVGNNVINTGALSLGVDSTGILRLGQTTATQVAIGKVGIETRIEGVFKPQGQIQTIDGTAAGPAYSFSSAPTTGVHASGGSFNISTNSIDRVDITDAKTTVTNTLSCDTIDAENAGALTIGGTTATSVDISSLGDTTSILGSCSIGQLLNSNNLDSVSAGALTLGGTNATSILMADTGVLTTVLGDLQVNGATTITGASHLNFGVNPTYIYSPDGNNLCVEKSGLLWLCFDNLNTRINLGAPLDRTVAAPLVIGPTVATAVYIGRTGQPTEVRGDLQVLEHSAFGATATPDGAIIKISETMTGTPSTGLDIRATFSPAAPSVFSGSAIGGFSIVDGSANYSATSNIYGLNYGIYTLSNGGSANLNLFGANIAIFEVVGQTLTAGDVTGIRTAVGRDLLGTSGILNCTNATGIRINAPDNGLTATNGYGLYIEDMTSLGATITTPYSLYIAGGISRILGTLQTNAINAISAVAMNIASTTASAVNIARVGITTTIKGALVVDEPVTFPSYTVAGVPSVTPAGQQIYVSNETGGAQMAFSDGTNWRRFTDRAIIS